MAKLPSSGKAKKQPQASIAPFLAATITPTDLLSRYQGNPQVRKLVDSCRSWSAIACHMKAERAASEPIRLYSRDTKGRKGKRVTGKRLSDLKRKEVAGTKSAQYAESAGANVVEVTDDPALNILHKPNPFVASGYEFFYWLYLLQEACGNAFAEVAETGDSSSPFQLLPMYPQDMILYPNNNPEIPSLVEKYAYGRGTSKQEFPWHEVIHFKRAPSMYNPLWGSSPLQAVLAESDLLEMATLNELALWQNGCSINMAYKLPPDATDAEVKQVKAQLEGRHMGLDKAGRMFIGTGELTKLDSTAREMQYRDGQIYYSQLILAAYRVPESKVRLNDANLGSSRTADIEYLSEGIRPMLVRMAELLTEELLYKRLGYERGSIWFAFDDIVPRDIQALQAAVVGNVQNGIWTPDEARAELGFGPLPDGKGSELRTPVMLGATPAAPVIDGQKVPQSPQGPNPQGAAVDAATAEAVAAPPADLALNGAQITSLLEVATLVTSGQLPADTAKEILFAAFPTVPATRIEAIISGLSGFKPSPSGNESAKPQAPEAPAPDTASGKGLSTEALEPPAPLAVAQWETVKGPDGKALKSKRAPEGCLMVLGGRSIRALDPEGKAITDAALNALSAAIEKWYATAPIEGMDVEARAKALYDIALPHLKDIFTIGGIDGLASLSQIEGGAEQIARLGVSFDVIPEKALAWLEEYTVKLCREITTTQREDLKSALSTALESGMNTGQATKEVQAALGDVARWKAEEITRTESTRAYTQGNLAAWREAEVTEKQWLLAPDACPLCKGIAEQFNKPHPIDTPFLKVGDSFADSKGNRHVISYSNIDAPPLHPGDRCDIVPVL